MILKMSEAVNGMFVCLAFALVGKSWVSPRLEGASWAAFVGWILRALEFRERYVIATGARISQGTQAGFC